MQRISVYDDTADLIDIICEELGITEAELIDQLIDDTSDEDINAIAERFYRR